MSCFRNKMQLSKGEIEFPKDMTFQAEKVKKRNTG